MRRVALAVCLLVLPFLGLTASLVSSGASPLAEMLGRLSSERMMADLTRLSQPDFNGRLAGSADDKTSAMLVAERFRVLGLAPTAPGAGPHDLTGWGMQDSLSVFQIEGEARLALVHEGKRLPGRIGDDFLPFLDSPSVDLTAPVVFVGYGLADPEHGLDEYAGLDVRNKVVLFLRGSPAHAHRHVTPAMKVATARARGARAFLTATGPVLSAYETGRGTTPAPMGAVLQDDRDLLPGAWISTEFAERMLSSSPPLRELQEQVNAGRGPVSRETGTTVSLAWRRREGAGSLVNVLALLPGSDPDRRDETVIVGAHRDHLGRHAGLVFPGADDNASGTALILEVARVLAESPVKPKRSVLVVSFSGEEQGLLGSRLYMRHPARPLARTVAMINIDHVGVGNGRLTVGVTGLPKEWAGQAAGPAGLDGWLDVFGFFPGGDHVPFKEAGIPTVTIVSGGPHIDFHRPTDTAEKIQPEIIARLARYVLAVVWQLANP
ncbi:M28 family peptidase [Candidatus Nitrospira bockiana]